MKKRISYHTSLLNVFTLLAIMSLIGSMVFRLIFEPRLCINTAQIWGFIVLPVAIAAISLLIVLFGAKERLYRISIPVWMTAAFFAIKYTDFSDAIYFNIIKWFACAAVAFLYTFTMSGKGKKWILAALLAIFLVIASYINLMDLMYGGKDLMFAIISDLLLLLSGLLVSLGMKVHDDGKYHPTWGDRADGRRVRGLSPFSIVVPYIMPTRVGSSNFINDTADIDAAESYISLKRKEGFDGFGITHIFLAAYVRCVAKYPAVNRFLAGQRVYSRGDDIQFCMIVKTEMRLDAPDTAIKLHLKPTDTVNDIYYKLNEEIEKVKNTPTGQSAFDKTAQALSYCPGIVFRIVIDILKLMDYFGCLPKFLLEVSPFHGSMFFTSMASLGIPPIVHHLYDFGNLPIFCAMGAKRTEVETDDNGHTVKHKYLDYTFNTDERICDGYYYASVMKYFKKLLAHPEKLELPPDEVVQDI